MEIIKTESGYAISFPYELKENFRRAFPSATWNPTAKRWEVGSRSGKRLEQWVELAREAVTEIEERDQRELDRDEIESLERDIKRIAETARKTLAETEEKKDRTETMRGLAEELLAARSDLAAARAVADEAEKAEKAEKAKIDELLSEIIDLPRIKAAMARMARTMVPADRRVKEQFEEAREIVKAQRDILKAAGWSCRAIDRLAGANVNRSDRDHPKFILEGHWYEISKIEKAEE